MTIRSKKCSILEFVMNYFFSIFELPNQDYPSKLFLGWQKWSNAILT